MSKNTHATIRAKVTQNKIIDSVPCLVFIRGGTPGKIVELQLSGTYIIGRSSDCQLRIDDPTVSGKHARIFEKNGIFYIEDLDSTNGTFLDHNRMTASCELTGGEMVNFGNVLVKFLLHGSAEHDYHHQLYDSVYRDSLTEVQNRRFLDENLKEILQVHAQTDAKFSLMILDIDHFKKVNDVHGHLIGDRILKDSCRLLEKLLREEDILVRYGGEEFVILMPYTGPRYATTTANRLLSMYREFDFQKDQLGPKNVTFSAGVSFIDYATTGYEDSNADSILLAADNALYKAKNEGRNRVNAG
jgi:diguanylate cyclase (GGDEF)-like protein